MTTSQSGGAKRIELRLSAQEAKDVLALMDTYGHPRMSAAIKACITQAVADMHTGGVGARAVADYQRRMAAKAAKAH